ncbi:MAG: glycosyltransferase [Bacteroidales bacterium]|nr:glycosyltransferase [Bacteroidales bacterium]
MILPKISIITPTFNVGESIEAVLLSVANQTYKNIEHIIVDGASKDKTLSTVRRFQKKYKNIRLSTKKDSGIYHAMNKGMDMCTGDWIYFIGADDAFYNEHVLTELFELGLFQEEQVIYGNVVIKGDAPWAKDNTIYDGPFNLEKLFRWNLCHQSILYPKSVIKLVGYYETKYKVTSDWDYNIRCWAKYNFTYADKIIAFFTTGGKSSQGGDYSLHLDFPNNVIKYFDLDVLDSNLFLATSQFYYPMSRYRENEHIAKIMELETETGKLKQQISDQQNEHAEIIAEIQNNHVTSVGTMRSEFDEAFTKSKTEHEQIVSKLTAESENELKNLKTEFDQAVNELKAANEDQVKNITAGFTQTIVSLNDEHDHFITDLKAKHDQVIVNMEVEHEFSLNLLKTNHLESINIIKEGYEEIVSALKAKQLAETEFFKQKEAELIHLNEASNQRIVSLESTISRNERHFDELVEKYSNDIVRLNEEMVNLKKEILYKKQEIAEIFDSYTWKTGKILLSPAVFIAKAMKPKTQNPE